MRDGDPWFVAVDACKCLDIHTDNAMSTLDDDEKVLITPDHYNTGVWNNAGSGMRVPKEGATTAQQKRVRDRLAP